MKLKKLTLILVVIAIATVVLTGAASAEPPKENFYFRWLWFLDMTGCDFRATGEAAHCPNDYYKVQVTSADPLFEGTLEFWFDQQNLAQPNEWAWFDRSNFQGGWRLQPAGVPDGWWEGQLSSIGPWDEWYEWYEPIAIMDGKGYGSLAGYQLKGHHWQEPDDGTAPFGVWPANGGELWLTGKGK
jgi:hypothetical protein